MLELHHIYINSYSEISKLHRLIIVLFDWGRKWPPLGSGNLYIEFYNSNNNVCRFLQLFNILMLFIETINYKTGPCVICRSMITILKKGTFFDKRRFRDV